MTAKSSAGKEISLLSEEAYFPTAKIKPDEKYYGVSLFSDNGVDIYHDVHCMLWTGFTEVNGKQAELRKAGVIPTAVYANHWKELGEPFSVVNTIDEFIEWFFKV